ncbi:molybdenum cofactor guanylyltransferase [Chloroflexota bacterium]
MTITTIVLAGGHSTRLGREKSTEAIDGEPLIERVLNRVSLLSTEILVVFSQRQTQGTLSPGIRSVVDLYPGKGSLGGIYTGLKLSANFYNLVVACDMPFLNLSLLRYMIDLSPAFDIIIPRVGSMIEPLHAVYSKNCLDHIEKQLEQGNLRIAAFMNAVKVRYVEEDELKNFDSEHLSFFNINKEVDLEKARVLTAREGKQVEGATKSGR